MFNSGTVEKYTYGLVILTVMFLLLAQLLPEAQDAGDTLNASGVPFGSLFVGGGIVFLIIMAGVLLLVIRNAMGGRK